MTSAAAPTAGARSRDARRGPRRLVRPLLAAAAGVAVGLAFQPTGWWPLLLVGLPLLTLVLDGVAPRRGLGLGYLFGLALLAVTISWVHVLGWWVAALLILFEALFFALLGLGLSLVVGRRGWPLLAACAWVAAELAYSRVPFGGFGWVRLGYAAVDTPLAGFLPLIGVAGVSLLVALSGQLVALAVRAVRARRVPASRPQRSLAVAASALVVLVVAGTALRGFQVEPLAGRAGSVTVGIVQGNVPGRGIEALGRARSVTDNHLAETVALMTRVRLGQEPAPDFVLWPENSTDIDPTRDALTRATVQAAAEVAGVPLLVGAVMEGPGSDERQTTALWWDPVRGVLARYDKRNLVPFGEWIPFRDQLLPVLPILRQVGAQSVAGTRPGVLDVAVDGRTVRVGDVICFELAYDATVYQTMTGGAQVSVVQSNNATYGGTGQIEQQFAITRARAMETRREIAVATTNSVSGVIDRDGRVVTRTAEFTADQRVTTMPLRTALTPAVRLAPWVERGAAALGLLGVLGAAVVRRRERERTGDGRAAASAGDPGGRMHATAGAGEPAPTTRRGPT